MCNNDFLMAVALKKQDTLKKKMLFKTIQSFSDKGFYCFSYWFLTALAHAKKQTVVIYNLCANRALT